MIDPTIQYVDVDQSELIGAFGAKQDPVELFKRLAGERAIPVTFDGLIWLRLDDCDKFRAHYILDEPEDGNA